MIAIVSNADDTDQLPNSDIGIIDETQIFEDTTLPLPCCKFIRGNVDNDPGDDIDINDLLYLVAYCYKGGPAPECMPEADVDGSGAIESAVDIEYLINYMFNGGPAPLVCPK
ncbi:MAG: hypothetical protein DWP97_11735 [Calditrichaeota bacterium]|nr:MAG: hypothetical protein DWP97_11735 [Calditrichota bacterium]